MSPAALLLAAAAQVSTTPAPEVTDPTVGPAAPKVGQITYVDLEAGVGYSTNPQFGFGSNTDQAFGRVSVNAVHQRVTDRTTTVLSAFAQDVTYTGKYGSDQSVSLNARHSAAVSETLSLWGEANFTYDQGGQLDTRFIGVSDIPVVPGTTTPPELLPVNSDFLTIRGKTYIYSAHAGGLVTLSPRDSLSFSSGVQRDTFRSGFADNSFWQVPVSLGYNRQISPRTTIGAQLGAEYTDYDGPVKFTTVTPEVTATVLLSERLTFSGGIGASFASIDDGVRTRHTVGLAGNLSLCEQNERTQFCGRVFVDQASATIAGPAKSVSAGVDYTRRLDAKSTVQLAANASHYSSPFTTLNGTSFSSSDYYRVTAAYTRQINDRLFGGVNLSARKLVQRGPDPKADLNASVFIRYRFGDVR